MERIRSMNYKNTIALLTLWIATIFGAYAATTARGDDGEKPSGFSGYLLDDRGLNPEKEDAIWREDFESSGVSWRYLYREGSVVPGKHLRTADFAHGGKRSEFLQYEVTEPGVVVLAHYVDYPSVYADVAPSLWIRSDRPGVSLAALVVFPKTLRPDTEKPLVAIVPGSSYQKPGSWQKLTFPQGLEETLEKTAQSIRGEYKIPVSVECAYVRQLLLVSEARAGQYSLWVDDVEIQEHLSPPVNSLREWERGSAFNPINLLSARLHLSNTPIYGQSDVAETDVYGQEPFAIDESKAKQRRRLEFVDHADGPSDERNDLAQEPEPQATFNAALAFLPSMSGTEAFSFDELVARTETPILPQGAVGQASFMTETRAGQGVVAAAFDSALQLPTPGVLGETQQETSELVAGSGTLARDVDAVTESFRGANNRLVGKVRFNAGRLETADGSQTYLIRAIEYQGESFEFLKKLGFNAIWLQSPPDARQLSDAQSVGIWLIAPPPTSVTLVSEAEVAKAGADAKAAKTGADKQTSNVPGASFTTSRVANAAGQGPAGTTDYFGGVNATTAYDPVLLWNVGEGLRRQEATALQKEVAALQERDPLKRPVVGSVVSGVDEFLQRGRLDVMMLTREPLQSSLDLNDYASWLVNYQYLATDDNAVFWNRIQTQPSITATLQRQFFGMADETPGVVSYEQMRQLVRLSMLANCRGLLFSSTSPLDAKDHKTQYRAAALESLNLELQLVAPWFALGKNEVDLVDSSDSNIKGIVSKIDRAILFVPVSTEQNNQYVMGQNAANNLKATIPVREGYSPDLLTPGALRKIVSHRRAGGCYFTLDEGSMNSLVFFTQNDSISRKISERAPAYGARLAKLAISLARKRLDLFEQTVYALRYVEEHGSFPKSAPGAPALGEEIEKIADQIDEADVFLQRRDVSQAYLAAERATRTIRRVERQYWLTATRNEVARPVTPLSTSFYDMPAYLELYEKLLSGKLHPLGANLILGGDMESDVYWSEAKKWDVNGWRFWGQDSSVLAGTLKLESYNASPDGKRQGSTGLKLEVRPQDGKEKMIPLQTDGAIIDVDTSFNAQVGQIICFQGWIKIPRDLTNSVDGIEIFDDQGGRALALRFREATDWKRFAFYRVATNNGPMRVQFSMSGVGEVWLDDVAAYAFGVLGQDSEEK